MNVKIFVSTLILTVGLISGAVAQKVGYANIQAIMANMPETKQMRATLESFSEKLAQSVTSRQQMLATLEKEYTDMASSGADQANLQAKQAEYEKLYKELLQAQQDAQQKLAIKQQDLMNPILDKIQKEIKEMAIAEGYDYIFNTVDGSGVSILLHGPESDDLTVKLAARLGVTISENN